MIVHDDSSTTSTVIAYSRLLSLAAHEFRTPVSVVGGYLRMLQRDTEPPLSNRQRKMVDEAERSCARLAALVSELSEISKLDAGLASMTETSFDLFGVLHDVADGVHDAQERQVQLKVQGAPSGAPMNGDLARLRSAFEALIRAVLREQPSATTVVVDRRTDADSVGDVPAAAVVVIAPQDALSWAFDAAPAPFDDKRGGLGLLLQIAQRVVERHGGRIWSPTPPHGAPAASSRGAVIVSIPLRRSQGRADLQGLQGSSR
jgi:signal transduction histidine kinase